MANTPWENDLWYTSPWNFCEEAKGYHGFAKNIEFHDVTLRDGEQQSGVVFNVDQKIAITEKLAEVGIQRVEAGMPVVTKQDEIAIREIVKRNFGPKIFTFSRCMVDDAKLAKDMGVDGVCMEIPANERLIKYGYKWETSKAIDAAIKSTKYAHEQGLYVCLFMLDYTRSDFDYVLSFLDAVEKDGHFDSLACVDTVGALNPLGSYFMIKAIKARYPGRKIEIHAHDDFGLGSANTVAALAAGADVAHTSISGIGERSGNVSYEEVDMQLLTTYGIDTGLKHNLIYPTSRFALKQAGFNCRPNKGIFGTDISKLESGLAVGWYENVKDVNPLLLIPYKLSITGHPEITYTIGKHSGMPTIEFYLRDIGIPTDNKEMKMEILMAVKDMAYEKGTALTTEEFSVLAKGIAKKY